jgi:hypothetical protein
VGHPPIRATGRENRERRITGGQEKTMSYRKMILLILVLVSSTARPLAAHQERNSPPCTVEYENHNQIDYGPLIVQEVKGTITDPQQAAMPKVCVAVFTEKEHKLIATTESDMDGKFSVQNLPPGRYRLIAKADSLCPANVPLRIVKPQKRKLVELRVHMKPRGLDTCSYGEVVYQPAGGRPTIPLSTTAQSGHG